MVVFHGRLYRLALPCLYSSLEWTNQMQAFLSFFMFLAASIGEDEGIGFLLVAIWSLIKSYALDLF